MRSPATCPSADALADIIRDLRGRSSSGSTVLFRSDRLLCTIEEVRPYDGTGWLWVLSENIIDKWCYVAEGKAHSREFAEKVALAAASAAEG